jgi:hypothetical protein
LKHKEKVNKARLVCFGKGHLDDRFRRILIIIKNNQGKIISELAKIMNRKKLWAQIRFLEKYKYIICEGYPKKVYISRKGLKELRGEGH